MRNLYRACVLFQVSQYIMRIAYLRCEPDQWQTRRGRKSAEEIVLLPPEWAASESTPGQLLLKGSVHSHRTETWTGTVASKSCICYNTHLNLLFNGYHILADFHKTFKRLWQPLTFHDNLSGSHWLFRRKDEKYCRIANCKTTTRCIYNTLLIINSFTVLLQKLWLQNYNHLNIFNIIGSLYSFRVCIFSVESCEYCQPIGESLPAIQCLLLIPVENTFLNDSILMLAEFPSTALF